jgi:hypothetical protein
LLTGGIFIGSSQSSGISVEQLNNRGNMIARSSFFITFLAVLGIGPYCAADKIRDSGTGKLNFRAPKDQWSRLSPQLNIIDQLSPA